MLFSSIFIRGSLLLIVLKTTKPRNLQTLRKNYHA